MSAGSALRANRARGFWRFIPLGRTARFALVVLVCAMLLSDAFVRALSGAGPAEPRHFLVPFATISLGLFVWRPPVAAIALLVGTVAASILGGSGEQLLAVSVAAGLVVFTCSLELAICYGVVVVIAIGAEVVRGSSEVGVSGAIVGAIVLVVSFGVGLAANDQRVRTAGLAQRVAEQAEELARELARERQSIADELHDIVAHDITIVAMQARVLEMSNDAEARERAQEAISSAARQALADIRRMLRVAHGEIAESDEPPSPQAVEAALAAASEELGAAGVRVDICRPEVFDVSRPVASALARLVRETATNIIKHATGATTARFAFRLDGSSIRVTVTDDSSPGASAGLPASGYGLVRMRERVQLLGGTFEASQESDGWTVRATLPLR